MHPIEFPQANGVRTAPAGNPEVKPLPVYSDGTECISLWRASWPERLRIFFTGNVWLRVASGRTQPPVCVTGEPVFDAQATSRSLSDSLLAFVARFRGGS